MAKLGEINYLKNAGPEHVHHAVNKPFSDVGRARYLAQVGAVFSLLPPPPARLLDLGCGTGWTSIFFAKAGYEVVGVDICADMIHHANRARDREGLDNLRFVESDYEEMCFDAAFDCAVFYDSLHHAVDEGLAVRRACEALRPGGVCVTSEPGAGHQDSDDAREAVRKYQVTEKDMPPEKVVALGRAAGFTECRVYPNAYELADMVYTDLLAGPFREDCVRTGPVKQLGLRLLARRLAVGSPVFASPMAELHFVRHLLHVFRNVARHGGIVRMVK